MYTLSLHTDIYCYTYYKYASSRNSVVMGQLLKLSVITLFTQTALLYVQFKDELESDNLADEVEFFMGDAYINMVRIVCSYFMHVMQFPNVGVALNMIQFAIHNSH